MVPEEEEEKYYLLPDSDISAKHKICWIDSQLLVGQAERKFYEMTSCSGVTTFCDRSQDITTDNIKVVNNILTQLENEEPTSTANTSDSSSFVCEDSNVKQRQEEDLQNIHGGCCQNLFHDNLGLPGSMSQSPGIRRSLVVDVHQETGECSPNNSDRYPRCYSESHRQTRDQQTQNLDKIETAPGDPERFRHFSESAVGRNSNRHMSSLSSELRQLRRSLLANVSRSQEKDTKDNDNCEDPVENDSGSTDSFPNLVKFDLMEDEETDNYDDYSDSKEDNDKSLKDNGCVMKGHQHPLVASLKTGVPYSPPGYYTTVRQSMSHSSSTSSMPICRICQLPSIEPINPLISPCRCLGSIRYVHNPCLLKWLEVCSKRNSNPPGCELCQFQYIRHKKFVISNWLLPSCSSKDKMLHLLFLVAIIIMITCSVITIFCFKQPGDLTPRIGPNTELSTNELLTLTCGVFFFLAFFVAMYVEVKSEATIYQLIQQFFQLNNQWTIDEYNCKQDNVKQLESP